MPQLLRYTFWITLTAFLIAGTQGAAQRPTWQGRSQAPIIGSIEGTLFDADTDTPLAYVQVEALSTKDSSLVGGALTDTAGYFLLKPIPRGTYVLRLTVFGNTRFSRNTYEIDAAGVVVSLGTLRVTPPAPTTEEVTVEAEVPDMIIAPDRRIYNVDQMPTAVGGSATDVLQNIPSITVDVDGNVELRGSANVVIWIDGKPSGLTSSDRGAILEMVPASLIERIEVITNPSSKYDAEGQAGIINIVTKKGAFVGTNGNVQLSAGTREKYGASVLFNKRTVKYNLSASYSYREEYIWRSGYSNQLTLLPDSSFRLISNSDGSQRGNFHSGRVGLDLYLTPQQTLAISANGSLRDQNGQELNRYRYETVEGITYDGFNRQSVEQDADRNYGIDLDYQHTFKGSAKKWSALASFSRNYGTDDNELQDDVIESDLVYQFNDNTVVFTSVVGQTDFLLPMPRNRTLEFGAKGTIRENDQEVATLTLDPTTDLYFQDTRNTDRFIYTEQVYAAYAQYAGKLDWMPGLEFSVGVRGEQTLTLGESRTLVANYRQSYFNVFPSAFLKYTPLEGTTILANYSRRVSRPRLRALNPFIDFSDTLNLSQGNPNLQPEFTDSYELSLNQVLGKLFISGTAFYRYTTNATGSLRTIDPVTGVGIRTWANFDSNENLGLEGLVRYRFGRSFLTASFNGFFTSFEGQGASTNGFNWNGRIISSFALAKSTSLQVTGFYFPAFVRPQGTIGGFSSVNLALQQEFLKRKLVVTLNVSDVFDTRRFEQTASDATFELDSWRKRESRIGRLSISYRFGSQDGNRRRQQRPGEEGQREGGGGEFDEF